MRHTQRRLLISCALRYLRSARADEQRAAILGHRHSGLGLLGGSGDPVSRLLAPLPPRPPSYCSRRFHAAPFFAQVPPPLYLPRVDSALACRVGRLGAEDGGLCVTSTPPSRWWEHPPSPFVRPAQFTPPPASLIQTPAVKWLLSKRFATCSSLPRACDERRRSCRLRHPSTLSTRRALPPPPPLIVPILQLCRRPGLDVQRGGLYAAARARRLRIL